MRTLALAIIFTLIGGAFVDAASPPQLTNVKVGINKQRTINGTKLTINFVEVVEDSRCPTDANCIWAGNAKIRVKVSKRGSRPQIIELNSNNADSAPTVYGYKLRLTNLTPEPASNIRIDRNGYVATINVEKLLK